MNMDERLAAAIALFDKEWAAIDVDLQNAIRRSVEEKTRDAAENAQKHPSISSTPLKEAKFRANATVTRLEKKYGPVIAAALSHMVTIAFARKFAENVDQAIEADQQARREKGETGLYAAACKAVDRMYYFGAGKWHWAQVTDLELKIFSDLLRWKAKNPGHDDPNSPWQKVIALYQQRRMPADIMGKLLRSMPKCVQSGLKQLQQLQQVPTAAEMEAIAGDWASYGSYGLARRTEGEGRLETDDPYGGFLRRITPDRALAMQDRDDVYEPRSPCLNENHWTRFDVPRSVYAVVENGTAFNFPAVPQLYPPLVSLKLIGVTLDYSSAKLQELAEAEAGDAPPEIIIETVRNCFLKHNNCHDEDLIRFWLFLIVGRRYPERVDALFPLGYFHGVRGPDIVASQDAPTHFQIVRVAADQDFSHMMRHPNFGPWQHL